MTVWGTRAKRPPCFPSGPIQIDREKLAWAAGLFGGEGCVLAICGARNRRYPTLTVTQAGTATGPPSVLVRYREAVGGIGYVEGPKIDHRGTRKPKWHYRASGFAAVQALVALMWPWLGDVKKEQARRTLVAYHSLPRRRRWDGVSYGRPMSLRCKRGHDYSDVLVDKYGRRTCRPCRRITENARKRAARTEKISRSASLSQSQRRQPEGGRAGQV